MNVPVHKLGNGKNKQLTKTSYLLRLRSGEKMSFPGWLTERHISPNISTSNQQHSNKWTWSKRLSSTKPAVRNKHLLPTAHTQHGWHGSRFVFTISREVHFSRQHFTESKWMRKGLCLHIICSSLGIWNNLKRRVWRKVS